MLELVWAWAWVRARSERTAQLGLGALPRPEQAKVVDRQRFPGRDLSGSLAERAERSEWGWETKLGLGLVPELVSVPELGLAWELVLESGLASEWVLEWEWGSRSELVLAWA